MRGSCLKIANMYSDIKNKELYNATNVVHIMHQTMEDNTYKRKINNFDPNTEQDRTFHTSKVAPDDSAEFPTYTISRQDCIKYETITRLVLIRM